MANRYWVGGSGTWDATSTTHWSATSGGASGASVPTTADNVFFDQAGTYTVTLSVGNVLDFTVSAGTVTFSGTGSPFVNIAGNFSTIAGTVWSMGTAGQIIFVATSAKTITTNGVTLTAGIITFNGTGGSWQLQDAFTTNSTCNTTLTTGTLNLNSKTLTTGIFTSSGSSTRTIAFGTGNITCLSPASGNIWDTSTSTALSTTGTQIVNIVYSGASAVGVTTGTLNEANSISFNFTGGTYSLTFLDIASSSAKNINFSGFAGTWAATSTAIIYGSLTLSASMTLTPILSAMAFRSTSGTQIITSNGKIIDFPLTFNGVGGTWQLADALTMGSTRALTQTNGTLDLNGKTLTVGANYFTGAGTKNLTFNGGTLVCPAASTTSFSNNAPTNYTTTAGTGTGKISMTAATAKTFVGGGSTFNCTLSNDGAGALTITGSNTFTSIANGVRPTSFLFTAGTTTTVTNWNVSGTAGNLVTIGSVTAATHTLSQASGTVSSNYLSISRSTATGGASWYAGANSTNGGNNTGWIFSNAPIAYSITATNGTYTLNGQSVGIARGIVLSGSYGSYAVTGRNITIAKGSLLLPQNGLYFLTGQAVDITYTPTPPVTGPTQYFIEIRSFTETRRI